jgi:type III secretion protein U
MSEKTEEATDTKLNKARKDGEVPKSQDMTMGVSMLGVFGVLVMTGPSMMERFRALLIHAQELGNGDIPMVELYERMGAMFADGIILAAPLLLVAMLFAIIGAAAHIGIIFSMKPVMPKFDAISPASGIKKVFSMKSITTFLQMLFKALVLGVVLWEVSVGLIPLIASSAYQSVPNIGAMSWAALTKVFGIAVALFMVLGPVDYAIQKFHFMKGQRMSKDDIKREHKESEGDPQLNSQRKALAEELSNEDPRQRVGSATAVIMNPTHYAVALRYRGEGSLPIIVAKGRDEAALHIRSLAMEMHVPVFVNPPLARALHKEPMNSPVPEELFEAVAAILRWVAQVAAENEDPPRA